MMKSQEHVRRSTGIILLAILLNSCSSSPEETVLSLYTVEIKNMQFQPSHLSVKKGDTIVFVNKDILVHDVTEEQNKSWASSPLSTDQSYRLIVQQSASYYCTIHPVMKGQFQVEQ